jgi:hypothetical protein
VIVEPQPRAPKGVNTLDCLSKAAVVEVCRYLATTQPSTLEKLYRKLDGQYDDVWSLDIDRLVCPYLPICDPIVNGHIVTIDGEHLTATFSATLERPIADFLQRNGIMRG